MHQLTFYLYRGASKCCVSTRKFSIQTCPLVHRSAASSLSGCPFQAHLAMIVGLWQPVALKIAARNLVVPFLAPWLASCIGISTTGPPRYSVSFFKATCADPKFMSNIPPDGPRCYIKVQRAPERITFFVESNRVRTSSLAQEFHLRKI